MDARCPSTRAERSYRVVGGDQIDCDLLPLGAGLVRPARGELRALDASPEPIDRLLMVPGDLVEGFDDQAYPLLFPEMQITGGLENAVGVHRLVRSPIHGGVARALRECSRACAARSTMVASSGAGGTNLAASRPEGVRCPAPAWSAAWRFWKEKCLR